MASLKQSFNQDPDLRDIGALDILQRSLIAFEEVERRDIFRQISRRWSIVQCQHTNDPILVNAFSQAIRAGRPTLKASFIHLIQGEKSGPTQKMCRAMS